MADLPGQISVEVDQALISNNIIFVERNKDFILTIRHDDNNVRSFLLRLIVEVNINQWRLVQPCLIHQQSYHCKTRGSVIKINGEENAVYRNHSVSVTVNGHEVNINSSIMCHQNCIVSKNKTWILRVNFCYDENYVGPSKGFDVPIVVCVNESVLSRCLNANVALLQRRGERSPGPVEIIMHFHSRQLAIESCRRNLQLIRKKMQTAPENQRENYQRDYINHQQYYRSMID